MKFAYIGDHEETVVFGLRFPVNAPVEVTDARVAEKLRGNPDFSEVFDGVQVVEPRRRGRPPKVK